MITRDNTKPEFLSKLFMYTTIAFIGSVLLQVGGSWVASGVSSDNIDLIDEITRASSLLSIVLSGVTIAGSVWILFTKKTLSKKITAAIYILLSLLLLAFSCYMIALSFFTWGSA